MKRIAKIVFIFFVLFLSFSSYNNISVASQGEGTDTSGTVTSSLATIDPNFYDPSDSELSNSDKQIIRRKTGTILGWLRNISVIVSVIAIMVVGLNYILGSVDEKAKYKETLIPIIIGSIVAVSGTTLVSFIYNNI